MTTCPGGSKGASSSSRLTDIPSVRIKLQYKTVSIMPLKTYDEFLQVCGLGGVKACVYAHWYNHTHTNTHTQYLKTDYGTMCEVLEPVIPAKAKVSGNLRMTYILFLCCLYWLYTCMCIVFAYQSWYKFINGGCRKVFVQVCHFKFY